MYGFEEAFNFVGVLSWFNFFEVASAAEGEGDGEACPGGEELGFQLFNAVDGALAVGCGFEVVDDGF